MSFYQMREKLAENFKKMIDGKPLFEVSIDKDMPNGWNKQAARRSMTSSKFADAFFKANR